MTQYLRVLTANTINDAIKTLEYAVRGRIVLRAAELEKQLVENPTKLPFKRITYCNIGNPQQLEQKPLTYIRQVLSLVEYPELIDKEGIEKFFPNDILKRAKSILQGGGTGAYSDSQGRYHVRNNIAAFINQRDGRKRDDYGYSSPENIFLTDGASPGVQVILKLLIRDKNDGVMIPIPQYPLYSASIPLFGGTPIHYYLDERKNWALDINELKLAIQKAKNSNINPRALVVINPGNPTGSCLSEKNVEDIIKFCAVENLVILADEVYQENVYVKDTKPFISFKKKMFEMSEEYNKVELVSFHSTSKGVIGECGKRGGYFELTNIDPEINKAIYKLMSINLCPNLTGQITMDLVVDPPRPGEPSYPLYQSERTGIYNSLKARAFLVADQLNALPGISCQQPEGALYAFPTINLPRSVIELAKENKMEPDMFYCLNLLDETGLCVVPGSGFGQKPDEYHFRTTILPKEEYLQEVLDSFKTFHLRFLNKYSKM